MLLRLGCHFIGRPRVSLRAALLVPSANERNNAVNDTTIGFQSEQVIPIEDVSDGALEAAAGAGREELGGAMTMLCTGISCPGGPAT